MREQLPSLKSDENAPAMLPLPVSPPVQTRFLYPSSLFTEQDWLKMFFSVVLAILVLPLLWGAPHSECTDLEVARCLWEGGKTL